MGRCDLRSSKNYCKSELSPGGPKFPRLAGCGGRYYDSVLVLGWVCSLWYRHRDVKIIQPHFQLQDYLYSALQKDLACRDAGWLGLSSDWGDRNQSPCGASPLPIFIPCGAHLWSQKCCFLLYFIDFLGPAPGGPKVSMVASPRWA